ncbi:MAG: hypothetical protein JXA09_13920 [Anaerolineae bacterium]|nr:hypothetical protein [Anaerolineae bacterium]
MDRLLSIDQDITRRFQFDYLVFDAVFLALYIVLLVRRKRFAALRAGLISAALMYVIDGVIWTATGVREYGISARWIKHPTDFMMSISYGIVAFSWVWIAFERESWRDVALWTAVLFLGWLLVPVASWLVGLCDEPIMTVRHMQSQVWAQIAAVVAGYVLLLVLGYDLRTILYVFAIGCGLTFMMEFSLLVTGIRPYKIDVFVYETLILTNQGIPYLYVIRDKILPRLVPLLARERQVA